jgi:DNA-binding phage protein
MLVKTKSFRQPKVEYARTHDMDKLAFVLKIKKAVENGGRGIVSELAREHGITRQTIYNMVRSPVDVNSIQEKVKKIVKATGDNYKQALYNIRAIRRTENPIDFIESEDLLNFKLFPMQRLIIKCFYGMPLDGGEMQMIKKLEKEGRTTYKGPKKYRELVVNAGMKSGKTPTAGVISCLEEYNCYLKGDLAKHYGFPPGKEVYILNVAVNGDQAKETIFAEIKARVKNSPYYALRKPTNETDTKFVFDNNVIIRSGHSNSSSLVGPINKLVCFDELARFTDQGGKYSADRVYYALIRSVEPFQEDGRIIDISSPLFDGDIICDLYHKSKDIDNMLGFHIPTWDFNPNLPFKSERMQNELKKNPEAFWRDFGAQPSMSQESYYRDPERLEKLFASSKRENPIDSSGKLKSWFKGKPGMAYYLHADPSVKNDAYGLSLGHLDGKRTIIDLAHRFIPVKGGEIDIREIEFFIMDLIQRGFSIKLFSYDTWQATGIAQCLNRAGIKSENRFILKDEHDYLKELIYTENIDIYMSEVLLKELKGLDLLAGKRVDHKRGGSKDIADAVAGVAISCRSNPSVEVGMASYDPKASDFTPEHRNSFWRGL